MRMILSCYDLIDCNTKIKDAIDTLRNWCNLNNIKDRNVLRLVEAYNEGVIDARNDATIAYEETLTSLRNSFY